MKNIVVYMNCHGEELIKSFSLSRNFNACFNVEYVITHQTINQAKRLGDENTFSQHRKKFAEADFIIYNPVSTTHGFWSSTNILKYVPATSLRIKIPYFRFDGYWLDKTEIKHSDPNLFRIGLPDELIKSIDLKNNNDLDRLAQDFIFLSKGNKTLELNIERKYKIELLKFKEQCSQSDVDMFDFFQNNHKDFKLFFNSDHPTGEFFKELALKVLTLIDEGGDYYEIADKNRIGDLGIYTQPILSSTCQALKLNFWPDKNIQFHNVILSLHDYVKLFIACNYFDKYLLNNNLQDLLKLFSIKPISVVP